MLRNHKSLLNVFVLIKDYFVDELSYCSMSFLNVTETEKLSVTKDLINCEYLKNFV